MLAKNRQFCNMLEITRSLNVKHPNAVMAGEGMPSVLLVRKRLKSVKILSS